MILFAYEIPTTVRMVRQAHHERAFLSPLALSLSKGASI